MSYDNLASSKGEENEHLHVVAQKRADDKKRTEMWDTGCLVPVLSVAVFLATMGTLANTGNYVSYENGFASNLGETASSVESYRPTMFSTATHRLRMALQQVASSDNILFGHMLDTVTGQYFTDWTGEQNKSDVLNSTGMYPAVYGFDFAYVIDNEYDFSKHMAKARARGGVVTFDWAADNPINGGDSYNKTGNPVQELMPGGSANEVWVGWLDKIADFLGNNSDVPVVFRLFHEMTGWWFWWGKENCNATEFKDAWKYTVGYIRIKRNISNVLFLYATSRMYAENHTEAVWTEDNMVSRYPGNDYVDAIGFDCYDNFTWYKESLNQSCEVMFSFALKNGRIPVIGETGHRPHHSDCGNCGEWWAEFYDVYSDPYSMCHHAAYMMTWSNYGPEDYYIPLPKENSYERFSEFMMNKEIQLGNSTFWKENILMTGYVDDDELL